MVFALYSINMVCYLFIYLKNYFNPHLRIFFLAERQTERERDREREREKDIGVREKHQLVSSRMCPDQGSNPQPFVLWGDAPAN